VVIALFVLAAGCLVVSSPAVAQDPGEGEVNISVEPTETDYGPNDTVTYEVIVEGADEGVWGYAQLDIVIEDPSVAQFVDFYETANDNDESNLSFSNTRIENMDGNATEEGPVFSMGSFLSGGTHFESDNTSTFVIAEIEAEVLGGFTSASNVSIVENPEPEDQDDPVILKSLNSNDNYTVNAMDDSEVALRDEANVSLVPAETELQPGETTTFDVVVEDAEYGIQSYDGFEVAIENPGSAQFVSFTETAEDNVDPGGESPDSNSEIRDADGNPAENGSVLWLDADLNDGAFDAAEEIVIATVEAEVTGTDTTAVTVDADRALQDLQAVDYEITETTGSELDPIGIDVTGDNKPATDTTGNGLLNDIDGDGTYDIFDVQALFTHFEDPVVQNNADVFDFAPDGEVNILDVQALFENLGAS
jgi:hypothetical protein